MEQQNFVFDFENREERPEIEAVEEAPKEVQRAAPRIYTVSEIVRESKNLLESSFNDIWVSGEISNLSQSPIGHLYFALKDDKSIINAIMFRMEASALPFKLWDGLEIIVHGRVSIYEKGGKFQIVVDYCEPKGKGALQLAFEQLKKKLEEEGLFKKEHKVPIPRFPKRIGVVTSPTGAAIRDIVNVLTRRFPNIDILLYPVKVQGEGAAEEIKEAICEMNRLKNVDVLIVGRGGGSLEDLWAFNEEIVARAIFASEIPVISAVGHEIDFTIADFVADERAPTPSAAAEIAVPLKEKVVSEIGEMERQLFVLVKRNLERAFERYRHSASRLRPPTSRFPDLTIYIDNLRTRLIKDICHGIEQRASAFNRLFAELNHLSPQAVLAKGYAVVKRRGIDKSVRNSDELKKGDGIDITFYKGRIEGLVTKVID